MHRLFESRLVWGTLLILAGIVFLLENLFPFTFGGLFWSMAFGVAGLFFLSFYLQNRANWWAFIPSFTLLGIGMNIFLSEVLPFRLDWLGGPVFLGMIGLSFVTIYLVRREFWWAVIPAGVMLTLASVSFLDQFISAGDLGGGIFFLGLGLTFALVAILPTHAGPQRWAFIPAGILSVMGLMLMLTMGEWINYLWPLALIGGGSLLLLKTLRPKDR